MLSPHQLYFAEELTKYGYKVNYLYSMNLSEDRKSLGWPSKYKMNVNFIKFKTKADIKKIINSAKDNSIHLTQGALRNGNLSYAQKLIYRRGQTVFCLFETINETKFLGSLKIYIYKLIFRLSRRKNFLFLAIGSSTKNWLIKAGIPSENIFEFLYFLKHDSHQKIYETSLNSPEAFKIIFIGRLEKNKNVRFIISCLKDIKSDIIFDIVGDGEEREFLEKIALNCNQQIRFHGKQKFEDVNKFICDSDLLVLPSFHDGFGAVISEALLKGTPVLASSACGASSVINHSNGKVFKTNSVDSFLLNIKEIMNTKYDRNEIMSKSAKSISANAGAKYFIAIIKSISNKKEAPRIPWYEERN